MKLTLPYPVSVNRYWLTTVNRKTGRAMMFPSKEGKAYKEHVRLLALVAGVRKPIEGTVEFRARLVPSNGVCMDLDNCLKVVIDALKDVAFGDDSKVFRIVAERAEADPVGGARLEVEIVPLMLAMPMEALHVVPMAYPPAGHVIVDALRCTHEGPPCRFDYRPDGTVIVTPVKAGA